MRSPLVTLGSVILVTAGWTALTAQSRILRVPEDQPTIQAAIDAAANTDTVSVANGYYRETIDFKGKAITVKARAAFVTISAESNGAVVTFANGEGRDSVLEGFSVTRGSNSGIRCVGASPTLVRNSISRNQPHGILCDQMASPAILENTIWKNGGTDRGGGIRCDNRSSPTIVSNQIRFNAVGYGGGGIYCREFSDPLIAANEITNNTAATNGTGPTASNDEGGAGIMVEDNGSPMIVGNRISQNITFGGFGGGIAWYGRAGVIANNVISHNQALRGGGIYNAIYPVDIVNNTIVGNVAEEGGGIIARGSVRVVNCILWSNAAPTTPEMIAGNNVTISYSNVRGGRSGVNGGTVGPGVINRDPVFADRFRGDFHLLYPSPCRNAGTNWAGLPSTDFEGDPRVAGGVADIGADEFHPHLLVTQLPSGDVEVQVYGDPGSTALWAMSRVPQLLDPPLTIPGLAGSFYLTPPFKAFPAGLIPASGRMVLTVPYPYPYPRPATYAVQALVNLQLTNAVLFEVR